MRDRDVKTATSFGILEKCKAFERDLLRIDGIETDHEGVDFDLNGYLSEIWQVIIIPKYDTRKDLTQIVEKTLEVAKDHGLTRTSDRIEDYGAHFYIVFHGWRPDLDK